MPNRLLGFLKNADAGPEWNSERFQPFLAQIGQLRDGYLLVFKVFRVDLDEREDGLKVRGTFGVRHVERGLTS